ncbi:hypothetical protein PR001_g26208 [Phytophthora rubi]|nr:hypothetical protein PR002_g26556 [Phytophthora rubi]KAE8973778.1 hypothetical protein PR001_g26208 [Phytophthora rubi]
MQTIVAGVVLTTLVLHEILRPLCVTVFDLVEVWWVVFAAASQAFVACVARGFQPRFPEWTVTFDIFQAVVSSALAAKGENIVRLPNAQIMRRNTEILGALIGWFSCIQHQTKARSFYHLGLRHLWLTSASTQSTGQDTRRIVVLYFHGGGYAVLCPRFYLDFCSRLMHQLLLSQQGHEYEKPKVSFEMLLANYRKLPEYDFPAPMDDALAMYMYLVKDCRLEPKNIILAGDSAGAGLVLSTLHRLKDAGRELPLGAVCASPMIDWPDKDDISRDCFVQAPLLTGIRDFSVSSSQEVHSLSFDMHDFPPIFVQTGETDLLHHQATRLYAKARSEGVNVRLDVHANMPHVFAALPPLFMPTASNGVSSIATFILNLL